MIKAINDINQKYEDLVYYETNLDKSIEFLTYLESIIPEFFSRNGEAKGIHRMFHYLTESENDNMIECVNVRESAIIYSEYIDGMNSFINGVIDMPWVSNSDMKDIELKLETATVNDGVFISSIFGGSVNDKKEMPMTESVDNIEYLIEFVPLIKEYKDKIIDVTERVKLSPKSSEDHEKLLTESLNMLYKSVSNYCKSNIINIFETYHDIMNKIDHPDSDVVTESPFQLVW